MSHAALFRVIVLLLLAFPCFSIAAVDLQGLVQSPPFGGTVKTTSAAPTANSVLEFRSVFADKGEYFFSVFDSSSKKAMWVGLNEKGNAFVVSSYDPLKNIATIDHQGRTLTLPLKETKILASAPSSGPTPPSVAPASAPTPTVTGQPVQVSGQATVSSEEATRLAQIADDIRRRRAERRQATASPEGNPPVGKP